MTPKKLFLKPVFVDFIPSEVVTGSIYISIKFSTATHKCACGCGSEVVTPLSPTDWKMTYDGKTITLYPSIGNWSFKCKSHYWVRQNRIDWAENWSSVDISKNRAYDRSQKEKYFRPTQFPKNTETKLGKTSKDHISLWKRLKKLFFVKS